MKTLFFNVDSFPNSAGARRKALNPGRMTDGWPHLENLNLPTTFFSYRTTPCANNFQKLNH
jgi:hypothetical protein